MITTALDPIRTHSPNISSSSSSSSSCAPSPAFSSLSTSTFPSTAPSSSTSSPTLSPPLTRPKTTSSLLPPPPTPPAPGLKWTRSVNAVERLQQEREIECADDQPGIVIKPLVEEGSEVNLEPTECVGLCEMGSPRLDKSSEEEDEEDRGVAVGSAEAKVSNHKDGGDAKGFDRFKLPTREELRVAKECLLVGESGQSVTFESLVKERGTVVVVFLRHLWCGLCAQYVVALRSASENLSHTSTSNVSTNSSSFQQAPPLYVLLISSGSPSLIPIYRQRLGCPFPLVVDKGRKLYKALGMTLKTFAAGKESEKGSYITRSNLANVVDSTVNGLAMRRYPGSQRQLGGEFVFKWNEENKELECSYASRMNTTRSHSEVRDLFAAAGVHLTAADELSVFGGSQLET